MLLPWDSISAINSLSYTVSKRLFTFDDLKHKKRLTGRAPCLFNAMLPVQVSGCRCSLCSHQGWGFPTAQMKLQRAEMGVNGYSCCWLIPAMDVLSSPQWHQPVFPPLHGTAQGTQGPPLTRDRAQTRSCWARWDNSMAKATIRQMLFSNPADPSQWKHPGAARRAAACLEKTQVAAQASQLSVLGVARTAPQRLWRSPAPVNATEQTL